MPALPPKRKQILLGNRPGPQSGHAALAAARRCEWPCNGHAYPKHRGAWVNARTQDRAPSESDTIVYGTEGRPAYRINFISMLAIDVCKAQLSRCWLRRKQGRRRAKKR